MSGTETIEETASATALDTPWNVLVYDDPVNLMAYVTHVFMKIFGYPAEHAEKLMMEVHTLGRSVVWTGGRERAEHFVQQLHAYQLRSTLEKSS